MASIRVGGDPENYMEAPMIQVGGGGKGGGGLIAKILDALGVNKQVANQGDSKPATPSEQTAASAQQTAPATQSHVSAGASLPALEAATNAFKPVMPLTWGQEFVRGMKPMQTIDLDSVFSGRR